MSFDSIRFRSVVAFKSVRNVYRRHVIGGGVRSRRVWQLGFRFRSFRTFWNIFFSDFNLGWRCRRFPFDVESLVGHELIIERNVVAVVRHLTTFNFRIRFWQCDSTQLPLLKKSLRCRRQPASLLSRNRRLGIWKTISIAQTFIRSRTRRFGCFSVNVIGITRVGNLSFGMFWLG